MSKRRYVNLNVNLNPKNTPACSLVANAEVIEKGWGRSVDGVGEVFAYHEPQEWERQKLHVQTVKILHIAKGKRLSRHFHLNKREYFIDAHGSLLVELWDRNGVLTEVEMRTDSRLIIEPGQQHRMTGLEDENVLVEVSTLDEENDSYRVEKGD